MNTNSHNLALAIVESSPDAMFVEDLDGTILETNQTACRLLGLSGEKLIGKNILDLAPEAQRAAFQADWPRMASGELKALETFIQTVGEEIMPVEIRGHLMEHDGQRVLLLIVRDISERKKAELERRRAEEERASAQKLESLGALAGGIAHDFNNLLQGIMGNATLCRRELPADSPLQAFLKCIEDSSVQASVLCDQMQAYAGQKPFTIERIQLNSLVQGVLASFKPAHGKKANVRFELATVLPEIAADAEQMRQVILCLAANAVEAMNGNAGLITIRTGTRPDGHACLSSMNLPDGAYVFLEVIDNGCGMTEETARRIFDPFFSTKFPGRGLGLAAALGIVRSHRGGIKVESQPGKGSTFMVFLPVAGTIDTSRPERSTISQSAEGNPSASTPRSGAGVLLVVDDLPHVLDVVKKIAEPIGFEVVCAEDGLSAIRLCRENNERLTAALVDMNMPDLNGQEVFRELRRIRGNVPVLLMSGNNSMQHIGWINQETNAGFLKKPFTLAELRNRLKALLAETPKA